MKFLCAVEAMNLSNLFGDCQDLSTSRGGSLAVLNIGDTIVDALSIPEGPDRITSGASQGLFRIEGARASDIEQRVRGVIDKIGGDQGDILREATIMVHATEEIPSAFQLQRSQMKSELRRRQMQAPTVRYPDLAGNQVCKIDHLRPGIPRRDLEDKNVQSDFTFHRRCFGKEERKRLLRGLLADSIGRDFEVVEDLTELSDRDSRFGNLKRKIAVLRFDGNGFGKIADGCGSHEALKNFSETIRNSQSTFFRSLIKSAPPDWWLTPDGKLRLEVVVYGGDEVMFIVPAWLGWKALDCFYRHVAQWPAFTYSGGIAFCHHNAPVHAIRQLVTGLGQASKDRAATLYGGKGDFTACQVLESFDAVAEDLDDFLERRYEFSEGRKFMLDPEAISLIERNMSWWRLAISRRKLHKLVNEIARGHGLPDKAIEGLAERGNAAAAEVAASIRPLYVRTQSEAARHDSATVKKNIPGSGRFGLSREKEAAGAARWMPLPMGFECRTFGEGSGKARLAERADVLLAFAASRIDLPK